MFGDELEARLSEASNMHSSSAHSARLREAILDYARTRMTYDSVPLDAPASLEYLQQKAPNTVSEAGMGGEAALELFTDVLAPACLSTDHPGYVSFIPTAPTEAATAFDLVVSASSIYGGSWMEGAGAVYAENEVLAWLAPFINSDELIAYLLNYLKWYHYYLSCYQHRWQLSKKLFIKINIKINIK
jgi:hypothetical protein